MPDRELHSTQESVLERALDFFGREIDQAFSEKRRLEDQIWDICKFAFSAEGLLVGAAVGAYQYAQEKKIDFGPLPVVLLALTLLVGLFSLLLIVRTRIYFVVICRHINAQRRWYGTILSNQPPAQPGYYDDPRFPRHFTWKSTQVWAAFLVALLNASVAAALAYVSACVGWHQVAAPAGTLLAVAGLQVAAVRWHLGSLDKNCS